ncbi:hypothetical protein [Absidia glauca]|uniref:Uncharacterized protein n=1 Tax=Absidia glauca TaxID=4829 RepID=A0A168NW14_ABSGL|nr:hypothetical protein [Absidia glauca]
MDMVFGNLKQRCGSLFSTRNVALMSAVVLGVISIVLIALELSFLPQWVSSGVTMVDFYIYIAITGVIIILTVIQFFMIKKRSLKGMRRLFLVLGGVCAIQFVVGLVHIGLLYSRYQKKLLQKCLQRSPPGGFWWSFGYESMDELNKAYQSCAHNWIRFSLTRLFSCLVYGFLACLCLFFIQKYYYLLKGNAQSDLNKLVYSSWEAPVTSPIEALIDNTNKQHHHHNTETEKGMFSPNLSSSPSIEEPPPPPFFYHSPTPTFSMTPQEREATEAIALEKHAQRQKLYDEIAKRRQMDGTMKSFSSSSSSSSSSNRSSGRFSQLYSNVHPFDAPTADNALPSAPPPMYDPPAGVIRNDLVHPVDMNQQPQQQFDENDRLLDRWGSLVFEGDKIRLEEKQLDHQRLKELRHTDDDFDQVRSRRSSKRHRKLSIASQDPPLMQRQEQFYPSDEPISPLETSRQHWEHQHNPDPDESAPLNPFDTTHT